MKCNLENREALISKYLMNELSDEESLKFEEHYFQCSECFTELKTAEQAVSLIRNEGVAQSKQNVKNEIPIVKILSEIFSTPLRIGFAAIVLLLAFLLYFVVSNSEKTQPENEFVIANDSISIKNDTSITTPEEKEELIADLSSSEFHFNPYLEEWMKDNVRSDENIIKAVMSPANDDKIIDGIVNFKWEMSEKVNLDITIMNNLERTVFSAPVNHAEFPSYSVTVNSKYFLKPGLYYWKLEDENEVVYLGKFYFLTNKKKQIAH